MVILNKLVAVVVVVDSRGPGDGPAGVSEQALRGSRG